MPSSQQPRMAPSQQPMQLFSSPEPVPYEDALVRMESLPHPSIWFLEHPHVYTTGTNVSEQERYALETQSKIPVHATNRGGQVTYHGPGQLMIYVRMDVRAMGIGAFLDTLVSAMHDCLVTLGLTPTIEGPHRGIWVEGQKVAFVGIQVRRGITLHGMALNLAPDLSYFQSIVPCGVPDLSIGSLAGLGVLVTRQEIEALYARNLMQRLGMY